MIDVELSRTRVNENGTATALYRVVLNGFTVYPPTPDLLKDSLPEGVEYTGVAASYACFNFTSEAWFDEVYDDVRKVLLEKSKEKFLSDS